MVIKQKKKIMLIAGSRYTQDALYSQLIEYIGAEAEIIRYTIDEGVKPELNSDLFVFSSSESYKEFSQIEKEYKLTSYIIGKRMISYEYLDRVMMLPKNQKIVFVNDTKESAEQGIQELVDLGIDYLDLIPYHPGIIKMPEDIKIAITPGEIDKTPKGIDEVYDIGVRILDFVTIVNILKKLDILDDRIKIFADKYSNKIIDLSKKIMMLSEKNEKTEKFLRQNIVGKGYYAKYSFDDIKGKSEEIVEAKIRAEKLAKTDLTILIDGESGTGKELFASAIHNASKRNKAPFIAVNFSAISDELLESELFGYEEGSFTGAKKGGKIGLFEQAEKGTIFLDEIGDISIKMQSKLLRVLQEKEIRRVGADRIIPVDIRIIAATNKDLRQMIQEKQFREDLYYRLKMGYVGLPALRHRKEDIPIIIESTFESKDMKSRSIDGRVLDVLINYDWPGNIRELINTLMYMSAVCDEKILDISSLPDDRFFGISSESIKDKINIELSINEKSALIAIHNLISKGELASREKIIIKMSDSGHKISDYQIRKIIKNLESKQLLGKAKGSYGLYITQTGKKAITDSL